jgi:hypothetical protein
MIAPSEEVLPRELVAARNAAAHGQTTSAPKDLVRNALAVVRSLLVQPTPAAA